MRSATLWFLTVCCLLLPASTARTQEPVILSKVRINTSNPIDFHAYVTPETLYVGQQATYQLAVFIDDAIGPRLRRNPEFLPPELRGSLSYELATPAPFAARDVGGKHYGARVFLKALFPVTSGNLVVPSSKLSYSMPQSASYFSREENHIVSTESSVVVVKPLPGEGRPADFSGAVGVLKTSVRVDASSARVGDPLVFTLRVQGTGNVKLLPRPTLEVEWASSVPGTERLQVDTTGPMVKGAKEFDWILTPTRDGAVTSPSISYSYFNPYTRKYETAESGSVQLNIGAGSLAAPEDGEQNANVLPLREHNVGVVHAPLTEGVWWWLTLLLLPLPAIALLVSGAPRVMPRVAAIDSLRTLVKKQAIPATPEAGLKSAPPTTARDVRRLLLSSLSPRLDISADVLIDRARARRVMLRRGVTEETAQDLLDQLDYLDVASFATGSSGDVRNNAVPRDIRALTSEVLALYERVDREALTPAATRAKKAKNAVRPVVVGSLIMIMCGVASVSVRAQTANAGWTEAVAAYKARSYVDAAEDFLRLAVASPRDVDALANWGIASWAAGDTVSAVMAWQRAVRLDPLAADLRENLLLLPSGAREGVAEIPMVPVPAFALTGVVAWAIGWLALTFVALRKRRKLAPLTALQGLAFTAIVVGALGAGAAVWGTRQLRSVGLAVVVRPETIHISAAPESDALGGAATGDVVKVDRTTGQWAHVKHADGRSGWLPTEHLAPLSDGSLQSQ